MWNKPLKLLICSQVLNTCLKSTSNSTALVFFSTYVKIQASKMWHCWDKYRVSVTAHKTTMAILFQLFTGAKMTRPIKHTKTENQQQMKTVQEIWISVKLLRGWEFSQEFEESVWCSKARKVHTSLGSMWVWQGYSVSTRHAGVQQVTYMLVINRWSIFYYD